MYWHLEPQTAREWEPQKGVRLLPAFAMDWKHQAKWENELSRNHRISWAGRDTHGLSSSAPRVSLSTRASEREDTVTSDLHRKVPKAMGKQELLS